MRRQAVDMRGIAAPGPQGCGESTVKYSAFADDLMLYLRSFTELTAVKQIMDTYERPALLRWPQSTVARVCVNYSMCSTG